MDLNHQTKSIHSYKLDPHVSMSTTEYFLVSYECQKLISHYITVNYNYGCHEYLRIRVKPYFKKGHRN